MRSIYLANSQKRISNQRIYKSLLRLRHYARLSRVRVPTATIQPLPDRKDGTFAPNIGPCFGHLVNYSSREAQRPRGDSVRPRAPALQLPKELSGSTKFAHQPLSGALF
ncbi:hypothetical protein J6590_021655 [Homalodisca vitripennis]|nr:hypothetical protein J6590_021655 [Homalodisca vitripennis]